MTFVASCSVCNAFVVMTFVAPPFVIWRIPDEIRHSVTELISTTNVVDNIFKLVEYLHFILYWISENQKHFILLLWHFCTLREKFLLICSTIERQKRVENRFPLTNNINMGVLERDERDMVFSSSSIFSLKLLSYLCPHEKQNLCYVCHFLSPGCCVCTLNSTNHPPTPFLPFHTFYSIDLFIDMQR